MERLSVLAFAFYIVGASADLWARQGVDPPKGTEIPVTSVYVGRVVDEAGKPVGGIYPMVFKLYPSVKSRAPIWSEPWWVAVDNGKYRVQLGAKKPLPTRADITNMILSVEITGVGEIVREPFRGKPTGGSEGPAASAQSRAKGGVKYADTAGYAVEAEHAKNSDRLQNLTLEEVTRKILEDVGGAKGGVRIGKARRLGNRVGGPGGSAEYNEICPPGTVMVGIRGGAGIYIDSIQIVCAPLE